MNLMQIFPPIAPVEVRGRRFFGYAVFALLLVIAMAVGALAGLIFVYASDLPQVRALEEYRPSVITEVYADDGSVIGSFALQRRVIVSYDRIPKVLREALLASEDRHFESHWGLDFPAILRAAIKDVIAMKKVEGASTITQQLSRVLFLSPDKRFRRKIQETLLAIQIERHYTKQQILTMYCNQIYLGHGNYGFAAAAQFYFGKGLQDLTLPEAATLVARIPGPTYSPLIYPDRALQRRNLVIEGMYGAGMILRTDAERAKKTPLGLNVQYPRTQLAPYFVEEIRRYLESTYGTEAVHESGLRVYTTLNVAMQQAGKKAVRDNLLAYERRHGWRGFERNLLREGVTVEQFVSNDWRRPIEKGDVIEGVVTAVSARAGSIKIGPYTAQVTPPDFAWTGRTSPLALFQVGDVGLFRVVELRDKTARVQVEQKPKVQGALVAIENSTGEIKAMVGGWSFEESKFNRATQALRQVGSSFKPYVYAAAIDQGASPFDTIVDAPISFTNPTGVWAPRNYDNKFEGTITLRRALAESRNVPAVKLASRVGIKTVIDYARRFGITSRLEPYLPLALGAAEITLLEHTSAFTVFPNDGAHVYPYYIQRVTDYDGTLREQHFPEISDALPPATTRTMVAMLRDVVEFGTASRARSLDRPLAGKTGTTNDWSDAWFIGFSPSLTCGVWVGFDDKRISLGKGEVGARAALPIWIDFMQVALKDKPSEDFPNVTPLRQLAQGRRVKVDTPDEAPSHEEGEQ